MKISRATTILSMIVAAMPAMANDLPLPPRPNAATVAKPLTPEERAELMALKIRAGASVKVKSYDAKRKTFDIMIKTEPAVGPNTTTLVNLKRAMGEPTAARRLGNPEDWIGREMTLVQDLILVPDAPLVPDNVQGKPATRRGTQR